MIYVKFICLAGVLFSFCFDPVPPRKLFCRLSDSAQQKNNRIKKGDLLARETLAKQRSHQRATQIKEKWKLNANSRACSRVYLLALLVSALLSVIGSRRRHH
jgi:hypothetical protein